MNTQTTLRLLLVNDRIAREHRVASDMRRVQQRHSTIRRTIGRSIIRIGERVAAEPNLRPAQSRQG